MTWKHQTANHTATHLATHKDPELAFAHLRNKLGWLVLALLTSAGLWIGIFLFLFHLMEPSQ